MNFLAHIYLSGNNDLVKIGNFMADGIRGKEYESFPPDVQKGILLHRAIDTFTDAHPIFRQGTKRLHEKYHHYAGVVMDVFYDHFLAKNWSRYSDVKLGDYAMAFYEAMEKNFNLLSDKSKHILPIMKERDWLASYATVDGITRILTQMDLRTKNQSGMRFSRTELEQYYEDFEKEFTVFFAEIRMFASEKIQSL